MERQFSFEERKFILIGEMLGLIHDIGKVASPISIDKDCLWPHELHVMRPMIELGFDYEVFRDSPSKDVTNVLYSQYRQKDDDEKSNGKSKKNKTSKNNRKRRGVSEPEKLINPKLLEKLDIKSVHTKWSELNLDEFCSQFCHPESEVILSAFRHHFIYKLRPLSFLEYCIAQADTVDSKEERDGNLYYSNMRRSLKVANPFGGEYKSVDNLDAIRQKIYNGLAVGENSLLSRIFNLEKTDERQLSLLRQELMEFAKEMLNASAMSLVPDNDSTVWDHGYSTATITKVMIVSLLLRKDNLSTDDKNFIVKLNKSYNFLVTNGSISLYLSTEKLPEAKLEEIKWFDKKKSHLNYEYTGKNTNKKVSEGQTIYYNILVGSGKKFNHDKFKEIVSAYHEPKNRLGFFKINSGGSGTKYARLFETGGAGWENKVNLFDCLYGTPHILGIQYPGRDFRTQVFRMPDFIGRTQILDEVIREIKDLIEVDYSLGNVIYEDINGIYFLVPDLKYFKIDIEYAVRKEFARFEDVISPLVNCEPCRYMSNTLNFGSAVIKLKKLYEKNLLKEIAPYNLKNMDTPELTWINKWNENSRGVCQLCGKMPENRRHDGIWEDKICDWCYNVRTVGKSKGREVLQLAADSEVTYARFMDQIMDGNQNIVLLVGDIGMFDFWLRGDYIYTTQGQGKNKTKKPGPSRLRAVIRSVEDFTQSISSLLQDLNLTGYSFTIQSDDFGKADIGIWTHIFDEDRLKDVIKSYIEDAELVKEVFNSLLKQHNGLFKLVVQSEATGKLFIESIITYPQKNFSEEVVEIIQKYFDKTVKFVQENGEDKTKYVHLKLNPKIVLRARFVYQMADEFMLLLPGNEGVNVVENLYYEFNRLFGKAIGRLSLNFGLVYARHKYPLYLILDSGKRMLSEFRQSINHLELQELTIVTKSEKSEESKNAKNTKKPGGGEKSNKRKKAKENKEELEELKIRVDGLEAEVKEVNENCDNKKYSLNLRFKDNLLHHQQLSCGIDTEIDTMDSSWEDRYYTNLVTRVNGELKVQQINDLQPSTEILFAPSLIDFTFLATTADRVNIKLDSSGSKLLKRNHRISPIKTRPLLMEEFLELAIINQKLTDRNVSTSSLKNLETLLALKLQSFYKSFESWQSDSRQESILDQLLITIVNSVGDFETYFTTEDDKREFFQILKDGRFFDLMEMRTFIYGYQIERSGHYDM